MTYPKCLRKDKYALRKWARAHNVPVPVGYRPMVPRVGPNCATLLKAVQKRAKIKQTGKFDDATLNLLYPSRKAEQFRKAVVAGYDKMKGSTVGGYWWKQIVAFAGLSGTAARSEWCAATWQFVLKKSAGYNGPMPSNRNYVPDIEEFAKAHGIIVPFAKAKPGMTITFIWSGGRGVGNGDHIGIVLHNFGLAHQIATWEGNTGSPAEITHCWRAWYNVNTVSDMSKLLKEK